MFWTKLKNKRVQIDADAQNDNHQAWCFNLWLDEKRLRVFKRQFSIYQAYEIKQMQWLVVSDDLKEKFIKANWQLTELLDFDQQDLIVQNSLDLLALLLLPLNYLAFLIQLCYRRFKHGQEDFLLNSQQAFFNDLKRQEKIFRALKRKLKQHVIFYVFLIGNFNYFFFMYNFRSIFNKYF